MPITIASSTNNHPLTKEFLSDGTKVVEANVKSFHLQTINPTSPSELQQVFQDLDTNQAIISGIHIIEGKETTSSRSKDNFKFDSPWIPMDRDYQTDHPNDKPTTPYIQLLADIDPQFAHVSYLIKNSASNIIQHSLDCKCTHSTNTRHEDCILLNPHRQKLWVQFHPNTTQESLTKYQKALFIKAYIQGYTAAQLSNSERSAPVLLHRTLFDQAAFQTQALSFEATPITHHPYSHNTKYQQHHGERYIDPTKLILSQGEMKRYAQIIHELKDKFKPEIQAKAQQIRKDYPEQDWDSLDNGILTQDTILYTTVNGMETQISTEEITDLIVANNITKLQEYQELSFKDPLDPDYGNDKAKLYLNTSTTATATNQQIDSVYLHSFAHGPHHFRILPNIIELEEALQKRGYITSYDPKQKGKKPSKELNRTFKALKQVAQLFYAEDEMDIGKAVDDLKQLASKPLIKSLLTKYTNTSHKVQKEKRIEDNTHPLAAYSFLASGSGRLIRYDREEGLTHFTSSGATLYLENKIPNTPGQELFDEWSTDPKREDVNGFGLYPTNTKGKLNMWDGFNTLPMSENQTESDIKPFIEFLDVLTNNDEDGTGYLLDWLADIIQNPLRDTNMRTGMILESPEMGTGKSTFAEFIQSFFHSVNTLEVAKLSRIVGQFNVRLMPLVFIVLNEVINDTYLTIPGVTNILKDMLGNPIMEVEQKGIDSKTVPNRLHTLVTTNHSFVYMSSNDRRWTRFKVSSKYAGDQEYFKILRDWWYKENGKEKVFTHLSNRNYQEEVICANYKGASTIAALVDRLYGVEAWMFWYITELPEEENKYTSADLYGSYIGWCEERAIPQDKRTTQQKLTSTLKDKYVGLGFGAGHNNYIIRKGPIRETFARVSLNSRDMDWSPYIEMDIGQIVEEEEKVEL